MKISNEIIYKSLPILDFQKRVNKILEDKNEVRIKTNSIAVKSYFSLSLQCPKLMIFSSEEEAFKFYQEIKDIEENIYFIPCYETVSSCLFANERQPLDESRILSLNALLQKNKKSLVVTTPQALILNFKSKNTLNQQEINLKVGDRISIIDIEKKLIDLGYKKTNLVEQKGDFNLNYDILSIFLLDKNEPVRVQFFDDEIEEIKLYDLSSGFSIRKIEAIKVISIQEVDKSKININDIKKAKELLKKNLPQKQYEELEEIIDENINNLNQNFLDRINFLVYFFEDALSNICDYLDNVLVIYNNDKDFIFEIFDRCYISFKQELDELIKSNKLFLNHKNLIANPKIFKENLYKVKSINFIQDNEDLVYMVENNSVYYKNYNALISDINLSLFDNEIVTYIFVSNLKRARLIQKSLRDNQIYSNIYGDKINNLSRVIIVPDYLPYGYYSKENKVRIIGSQEIYYGMLSSVESFKKKKRIFTIPKIGDYVVHIIYGIAICKGIKKILLSDQTIEKDFLVLEFQDGATISIPMEQLDKIYKYSGSEKKPKLSKIGSDSFKKTKQKARDSIKKIAFSLNELYKKRENQKGYTYKEDDDLQIMLERDFEFEETEDQISAIKEIKQDMETGHLMDRLICGDVGYGKTEVALRAVFKTAIENKQVVILCPTTLLARQHYKLFKSRFEKYGLEVELLTRLNKNKEQDNIIKKIKEHKIDVIISTHRILSKDIEFADLGLLVIDEEQRFGVEQKEKIKHLKTNINILSLSATPIPRTLNMALTKIRDISLLTTPPKDRNPVKTFILKENWTIIKEAIEKELQRNGQVYILNNRIETLENIELKIKEILPEIKITSCYGGMDKKLFEKRIEDFYNNKVNVLVSTTIIENGIDIPNANTLIVLDSNKFGLSQLYQIRGRVGRSNKQSYAYFFYKNINNISDDAIKRLNVLKENIELGSGFKIAMRDLEIRGAGNLLGAEQSGHMDKLGYDLYCNIMQEEVDKLNGIINKKCEFTTISCDIANTIPDSYIENYNEKIKVYQEISNIEDIDDVKELIEKLEKTYGKLDECLLTLIKLSYLKTLASKLMASEVRIKNQKIVVIFEEFLPNFLENLKLYDLQSNANYLSVVNSSKLKSFELIKRQSTMKNIDYLTKMFEILLEKIKI